MKIDLTGGEIQLSDNRPICARQARGLRIACTAGIIWITDEGVAGDTYLRPGQSHTLQGNGLAIIESIGDGRIRLQRPQAYPWLRALTAIGRELLRPKRKTGCAISRFS